MKDSRAMRGFETHEQVRWEIVIPNPIDDLIIEISARGRQGATIVMRHSTKNSMAFHTYLTAEDMDYILNALTMARDEIRLLPLDPVE